MFIKVLRQTMLAGQVVRVGDVIEASPADAKFLIGINKAVEFLTPETIPPTPPKRRPSK